MTKLLKLKVSGINLFKNKQLELDFLNKQKVINPDTDPVVHICNSIYINKTVTFTGINSSGKTTVLKILEFVMFFMYGWGMLDTYVLSDTLKTLYCGEDIVFDVFFFNQDTRKLIHHSLCITETERGSNGFMVKEEIISDRRITTSVNSNNIFDANLYKNTVKRSNLNDEQKKYTNPKTSIGYNFYRADSILPVDDVHTYIRDSDYSDVMAPSTNENIVQYLDSSIEYIKEEVCENGSIVYKYKRHGSAEQSLNQQDLRSILSSGTKKGMRLFRSVKRQLLVGGYLIVDEIENSMNKTIVSDVTKFFCESEINQKDAVLIFSTHYTEIVDLVPRNDSIFICHKDEDGQLNVSSYVDYEKRTDVQRSPLLISDCFNIGTAISYEKYRNLRKYISNKKSENKK